MTERFEVIRGGTSPSLAVDGHSEESAPVFTQFLRALSTDEPPPEPEVFTQLLERLRRALVHTLRQRGLWWLPPRFLGVEGSQSWNEPEALEELVFDCYEEVFLRRLPGLLAQADHRENVDGLVFRAIRNFIFDAQRRHDPLGFRVFDLLRLAVEAEVERGRLKSDETASTRSWSERRFQSPASTRSDMSDPREVDRVMLSAQAARWNDELMPDLITAWERQPLIDALGERLAQLAQEFGGFRFGDLIDPMKQDLRTRWLALGFSEPRLSGVSGGTDEAEGWETLESREGFEVLTRCVEHRVRKLDTRARTQDYLSRLWSFLCRWASPHAIESNTLPRLMPQASAAAEGEALPSDRRLGELLEIPRNRIAQLRAQLGRLLAACRGSQTRSAFAAPASHRVGNFQQRSAQALSLTLAWAAVIRAEHSRDASQGRERLLRSTVENGAHLGDLESADSSDVQQSPRPRNPRRFAAWGTLAAGLAIAAVGLATWVTTLQRDLVQSRGPRLLQTEAAEDLRLVTADRSATLRRIPGADYSLLYLDLQGMPSFPQYRVVLLAPDGAETPERSIQRRVVWASEPVAARRELMLYLPLAIAELPGLQIRFLGIASGGEESVLSELPVEWSTQ